VEIFPGNSLLILSTPPAAIATANARVKPPFAELHDAMKETISSVQDHSASFPYIAHTASDSAALISNYGLIKNIKSWDLGALGCCYEL
jgi:hypothetical protein